jgi:hypothetical protein
MNNRWFFVICLTSFSTHPFFVRIPGDVPPATGRTLYGKTFYDLFVESAKKKNVR